MTTIDFWYSIGSTYTYLSVMRLEDLGRAGAVGFRWRPFDVRHVMTVQNNVPFKDKPTKMAYMWRDIERRAARHGLTPTIPAPYPLVDLALANRVAQVGVAEGWVADYTRAAYRRWFERGEPAGDPENMAKSLADTGQDPARVLGLARSDAIANELTDQTETAMALGVFGSPSFVVAGEVFWGDDRLEDAIDWARTHPAA